MPDSKPTERRGRPKTKMECLASIVGDLKIMLPLIITLLGGTLYGNVPAVKQAIHGKPQPLPTADDIQLVGEANFQDRATASITSIIDKLANMENRITRLESYSTREDSGLKTNIEELRAEVRSWHE